MYKLFSAILLLLITVQCKSKGSAIQASEKDTIEQAKIIAGSQRLDSYKSIIENKRFGLVINQTSLVNRQLLPDTLMSLGLTPTKIYTPEHGFSGTASAGEKIEDSSYREIEVISLYGKNKKPGIQDLEGIDVMLFDLQDVGVRFYTYISTLHYVMEACAENGIPVIVLDRPNPNGFYLDGPVLDPTFRSFIGMHPVPVVYGMTIGEYSKMINGEGWLKNGIQCKLTVIPCENYEHSMTFPLEVKPSPNLPNHQSVLLYPTLCFFEGTSFSVGRGTDRPFQMYGHPDYEAGFFTFIPKANEGAKNPKHEGIVCKGFDLSGLEIDDLYRTNGIRLEWILDAYMDSDKSTFFLKNNFFDKLAGTDSLRQMIIDRFNEAEIRNTWKADLSTFKEMREKYLIYE